MVCTGHLDVHQSHYRLCAPCADREGGREDDAGRGLLEPAHLHHRPHLLDRHGHARLGLPEPDCVRAVTSYIYFCLTPRTGRTRRTTWARCTSPTSIFSRTACRRASLRRLCVGSVISHEVTACAQVVATVGFVLAYAIGYVVCGRENLAKTMWRRV